MSMATWGASEKIELQTSVELTHLGSLYVRVVANVPSIDASRVLTRECDSDSMNANPLVRDAYELRPVGHYRNLPLLTGHSSVVPVPRLVLRVEEVAACASVAGGALGLVLRRSSHVRVDGGGPAAARRVAGLL